MIEHKIGEEFIFTDENFHSHKLITEEYYLGYSCKGCYFFENYVNCNVFRHDIGHCHEFLRGDGKYTIFKEVK